MMRIAIDGRALTEGRQSGVQEYVRWLLWSLVKVGGKDVEIVVFISGWGSNIQEELPAGVTVVPLRWPNKILTASQLLLTWPRWDRVVSADVFIFPNLQLLPVSVKTPVVAVAHDLSFEQFPEFLTTWRRWWHRMVNPRQFFARASKVVAVSEHTKQDLLEWYELDEQQVEVVHSGLAGPNSVPSTEEVRLVREAYQLSKRYVLYLGAMEPRKNIVGVVRAFEHIADRFPHDLVLAGEYGWREGELESAVASSGVRNRIHRLGVVTEEEKWALYAGADVFVYPSFYEGFGFPPLEALYCGTPVITSVSSALPEVVGEWAVLVDPQARGQLVVALEEVLSSGVRVSPDVRKSIEKRYTWERCAEDMLRIVREVV